MSDETIRGDEPRNDRSTAFEQSASEGNKPSDETAEIPIVERLQVSIDDAARLLTDLKERRPSDRELAVVRAFDAAERSTTRPRLPAGYYTAGGHKFVVEGSGSREWIVTNHAIPVGDAR